MSHCLGFHWDCIAWVSDSSGYYCDPHLQDIGVPGAPSAKASTVCTGLRHLRLASTAMTPRAAFAVAMGFSLCSGLNTIDCSHNHIGAT